MPEEKSSDTMPAAAAETPEDAQEQEWPIRAEIALPTHNNLIPDGGRLSDYQARFARIMYEKGAMLRCLFASAIHAIHPKTGTIDVIGSPETVSAILKASRGEILALRHHWVEDAINHSSTNDDDHPHLPLVMIVDGAVNQASPSESEAA